MRGASAPLYRTVIKIKYIVIKPFNNMGAVVMSGDSVECDPGRASKLRRLGLIGRVVKAESAAALSFKVTYFDDSGKEVTQAVEAGSYQQAVDKVIKALFADPEPEEIPVQVQPDIPVKSAAPAQPKKPAAPKASTKAVK